MLLLHFVQTVIKQLMLNQSWKKMSLGKHISFGPASFYSTWCLIALLFGQKKKTRSRTLVAGVRKLLLLLLLLRICNCFVFCSLFSAVVHQLRQTGIEVLVYLLLSPSVEKLWLFSKMKDFWLVVFIIKILRLCRDLSRVNLNLCELWKG